MGSGKLYRASDCSLHQSVLLGTSYSPHMLQILHHHPYPKADGYQVREWLPVALTPIVMKCFERLIQAHIKKNTPTL